MKILTNKEYEELVNVVSENVQVESLRREIARLRDELKQQDEDNDRALVHIKEDFEREKSQWKYITEVEVAKALKTQLEEIAKLKLNLGNAEKEVEILNRAFENLGFDVKDMKEILNKLVDGVVAKSQIQLVK